MKRLLLVRHAATAATRALAFPADEALDARSLADAATLGERLPAGPYEGLSSPALRCRQTAAAAGLDPVASRPELAECDFGSWTGRTLEELQAADAHAVTAWMTDPDAAPHCGESLTRFATRVAGWMEAQTREDGGAVAITHGGVVKAAVVHALGAPLEAFWRIDVAPLAITELHAHEGRWTVTRVNATTATRIGARV